MDGDRIFHHDHLARCGGFLQIPEPNAATLLFRYQQLSASTAIDDDSKRVRADAKAESHLARQASDF